jgi:hypothetical protein
LQEKYDCGGISQKEWQKIEDKFGGVMWNIKNSENGAIRELVMVVGVWNKHNFV